MDQHDVIVIGGGVGGASLGYRLATRGQKVLVLEQSRHFRDRVRGDTMYPWGVAEAAALGLLDVMLAGGARRLRYWRTRFTGHPAPPARALEEQVGQSALAFFHPELQRTLLAAAAGAGATVKRGARATHLTRTAAGPQVGYVASGVPHVAGARLVVGADGRNSAVSRWAGFQRLSDAPRLMFAGVLLTGATVESESRPADTGQVYFDPPNGLLAMLVPIDHERTRLYAGYHLAGGHRPEVGTDLGHFLALAQRAGVPSSTLAGASQNGPLAAFAGADHWASTAYDRGVALLGDAAAASDPSFGSGMALTLLSARLLADAVLAQGELTEAAVDAAGRLYARQHVAAYGSLHRQTDWLTDFYRTPGPEADELRSKLAKLHAAEPWRVPDVVGLGPKGPSDEAARRAFLGLDAT